MQYAEAAARAYAGAKIRFMGWEGGVYVMVVPDFSDNGVDTLVKVEQDGTRAAYVPTPAEQVSVNWTVVV